MRIRDLHELPKLRDGLSYLYLEHCIIDQKYQAVEAIDKEHGRTMLPAAALAVLMLGPGTSITHEAVKTLCDNGCSVLWCGEEGVRLYAQGVGETRKGYRLIRQAELVSDPARRMQVITRMYRYRFDEDLEPDLSLEQVRGYEGVRVRKAYAQASQRYGVPWSGRRYDRADWGSADPINRALSTANACMNGVCHAAIVSAGYSPGLGFIHTGKQLSFVYDVADLYKTELTVPLAFRLTAESTKDLETRVRHACRDVFRQAQLLARILPDIDQVLGVAPDIDETSEPADSDPAWPAPLWSAPDAASVEAHVPWSS
jgi:CRISPR-associated protein Cas1